jgi:hypothetical protein
MRRDDVDGGGRRRLAPLAADEKLVVGLHGSSP